jgi:hypothetical protein
MRRADIEVPNPAVDVNSWAGSACYPQGSFYPISYGPSTWCRRITKAGFPLCAACVPCSQAPLCLCTRPRVAIPREGTIARLRYLLGGVRPRQTTHQPRSATMTSREDAIQHRVVFHLRLRAARKRRLTGSHLCYAALDRIQWQAVVKLHGVFLSCYGFTAS